MLGIVHIHPTLLPRPSFILILVAITALRIQRMDPFDKPDLTKKEERYREKVQNLIEYCLYCQPYDEGEAVWIHGDRRELDDVFYECNVPEQYWDNIMEHLHCPNCGLDGFELGLDVGTKTKFEKEVDEHLDKVDSLYGTQVQEFEKLIEQFPMLGHTHKFGKRIFKELEKELLPTVEIHGNYYRARKVTSSEVLSIDKMYNPPTGKPQEGRFNHSGQSHLYLANSKETAIKEVVNDENSLLVWCQEFEIKEKVKSILDLSFDWMNLTPSTSALLLSLKTKNTIDRSDRNKEFWRPDYYITRYIMDCAKRTGYNGIKYNSTKDSLEHNIVLFSPENIKLEAKGSPIIEIFLNKKEKEDFNDDLFEL
ncbi:RES family NAD+ phosphorylase [Cyclobacterium plantarum]|uniref:RES family NAD+ phosphorylase n=1 Tax=Cyclobacterium plantarum TaxID=2716263 RepID=UPI003F71FF27